jgi:hypothetical protein
VPPGVNWEGIIAVLAQVSIIAVFQERALALIFEHRSLVDKLKGWKEVIAFAVSFAICRTWDIDVIGAILNHPHEHTLGIILSAAVVAGGSKVPMILLQVWQTKKMATMGNGGNDVPSGEVDRSRPRAGGVSGRRRVAGP